MYSLVKYMGKITFLITWSAFRTTPSLSTRNEHVVKVKYNLSTTADFLYHGLRHLGLPFGIQNGAEVLMWVQRSVYLNTILRIMRMKSREKGSTVLAPSMFLCGLGKRFCIAALYSLLSL